MALTHRITRSTPANNTRSTIYITPVNTTAEVIELNAEGTSIAQTPTRVRISEFGLQKISLEWAKIAVGVLEAEGTIEVGGTKADKLALLRTYLRPTPVVEPE